MCEPDASLPTPPRRSLAIRLHPNNSVDALAALLRACAASASLSSLRQTHARILRAGLHTNNSLAATLLSLYANLSPSHLPALRVFSSVCAPALSLFNRAIRAFSASPSAAPCSLRLYLHMTRRCISPDNFTIPFLLNCCAALSYLATGGEVHSRAMKTGYMGFLPVPNALIDMYGKCGALKFARRLFDEMPVRDVVSYNALLGAHAKMGEEMASVRRVFDTMPQRNAISWNAMIVGYVNGGDLNSARACFNAMPVRNVVSWTTMLVGYTRHNLVKEARLIFDRMPERNLVSWTAMITGYAQNSRPGEALSLFHAMERAGVNPDAVTMTGVISAVAQLGSVDLANWVGACVERSGIDRNQHVLTALADMHAKCGNADEACRCFQQIPSPDSVSYSALINGLASHGHGLKALDFFTRMQAEGVEPDRITFVGVLNACSHAGLVDEGLNFWNQMVGHYGIEAGCDHYACMVDMLGRAGRLEEAHGLVESMPMKPYAGALGALLSACRTYDNAEIAEAVVARLFELEPENTGNYLLLWSIYAARQQWADAARVRRAMAERGIKKLPGFSWN
ncbi:hypothetical protein Taro_008273 [Colocasia esculenta]|uniref:Pentatricopeptide repeat-containing protein n=1 Tax=Colocasia esculenta TaxID=4460 RepID=A0A843U0L6_COLES|nr:hypothetical protein [Colocasia esculenta]